MRKIWAVPILLLSLAVAAALYNFLIYLPYGGLGSIPWYVMLAWINWLLLAEVLLSLIILIMLQNWHKDMMKELRDARKSGQPLRRSHHKKKAVPEPSEEIPGPPEPPSQEPAAEPEKHSDADEAPPAWKKEEFE